MLLTQVWLRSIPGLVNNSDLTSQNDLLLQPIFIIFDSRVTDDLEKQNTGTTIYGNVP